MKSFKGLGIFLFRVFMGSRIFMGVWDYVVYDEKMTDFAQFLASYNVPYPTFSAPLSVYAQMICGFLILLGFQTRFVAFLMLINFLVAFFVVDIHGTLEQMTPALAMLFGSLLLIFEGSGKYSLDYFFDKKETHN
ncbi:MAG: DoxX family protein [Moheibacter sp.]